MTLSVSDKTKMMNRIYIVSYLIAFFLVATVDTDMCMFMKRQDTSSGRLRWSLPSWKRCLCHGVAITHVDNTRYCPIINEDQDPLWFTDFIIPLTKKVNWTPEKLDEMLDRKLFCDIVQPTIHDMPADIIQNPLTGEATAIVSWTVPTASDNSGSQTLTSSHNPGDSFPIGDTLVTYTSIDPSGNTEVKTLTVTVKDSEKPVILNMPTNITHQTAIGEATVNVDWTEPSASDNSGSQTLTSSHNPGYSFPIGDTPVTYTSTDPSDNTNTQYFIVKIQDFEDPVISSIPVNITEIIDNIAIDAPSKATISWVEPTATDNSGLQTLTTNHAPGSLFSVGVTGVTYTLTDKSGNTDKQTFFVTVKYKYIFTGWSIQDRGGTDFNGWTMVALDKHITCDGFIAQWRYQAKASYPFKAIIWRPVTESETQFTVVGINDIPAGAVNQQVEFLIPEIDRITVQAGDRIGWSFGDGVLAVSGGGIDLLRWLDTSLHSTLAANVMVDFGVYAPGNREYSIKATVKCF